MASSGSAILGSISNSNIVYSLIFNWKIVSQDIESNSSTISWNLTSYLSGNNIPSPMYFKKSTVKVRIESALISDQTYHMPDTDTIDIPVGSKTLYEGTLVIPHENTNYQDFRVKLASAPYLYYGAITAYKYYTVTNINYHHFDLDYIVRKASLLTYPSSITDEDSPTITYKNPAGEYATLLQAGMSLTTSDTNMAIPYRNLSKTGNSYTFNFTASELAALYAVLDNRITSGIRLRLFLKSTVPVLENTATQTVTEYKDIVLSFINYQPVLNVSLKDTNLTSLNVTGNDQIFVNYISDIYFNLGASARKGASIKTLWIQNGDNLITDAQTGYLTSITSDTFYAYVEDNRGYYAAYQVQWPTFIPYYLLTLKAKPSMLDANGRLTVNLSGKYFDGSFGAKQNTMRMEYRIRPIGDTSNSWSTLSYITPSVAEDGNYTYSFTITNLDYMNQYELTVRVIDEVMTITTEAIAIINAIPVFDWSKDDFKFNVPVTINDATVPSITLQGTSGNWTYRKWSDGIAECWAVIQVTTAVINASAAGWYGSGELVSTNLSFPFTFKSLPVVTVTLMPTSNTWGFISPSNTGASTGSTGTYQINSMNSSSTKTYTMSYQVRGRWK